MSKHFYTWFTCCLFALLTALPLTMNADELTVNDGTSTSSYVPAYAFYGDYGTRSQFVVPASDLEDMAGGTISAMKFYAGTSSQSLSGTWEVYLKEVTETVASSTFISRDGATVVYTGTITVANSEWNITFASPFSYQGGNLMMEFLEIAVGNAPSFSWYGVSGTSVYKNGSSSDHTTFQTATTGTTASFVPKVTFTYTPVVLSCAKPGAIVIGDVTANSVAFSWTASTDNETSWTLLVKNGDEVLVNNETVNTPSYTLSGLNPSSSYSLSVDITHTCSADDYTTRKGSLTFETPCGAISSLPWSEGFETMTKGSSTAAAPRCWALKDANDGTYPYIFVNNSSSYVHTGSQSLYFQSSSSRAGYVILPEFSDEALVDAQISFYYKHENASSSGIPTVGYMTDITSASSFVAIQELERSTTWQKAEVELGPIPSGARIAIRYGQQSQNYYMGIDDIVISKLPNCRKVKNAWVEDIQKTSAKLVWNAASSGGDYSVIIKNGEVTLPEMVVTDGDTSVVVNNLPSASLFQGVEVSITTVCSATDSSEVYTKILPAFTTGCDLFEVEEDTLTLGFEAFDNGTSVTLLPCWDSICPAGPFSSTSYKWAASTTYAHSGSKSIYMSAMSSNVKSSVLVSPGINLPENYEFVAYVRESSHNDNDSLIFYVNTVPSLEGATRLGEAVMSASWTEFRTKLVGLRDEIYILVDAYAYNALYIDDFTFRPAPSCLPASAARLDSVGLHHIELAWTPGGDETQWRIDYYFDKSDPSDSEVLVEDTPKFVINGLESSTADTVFVSITAICGEDNESEEVLEAALAFHTPAEPATIPYVNDFEDEHESGSWLNISLRSDAWYVGEGAYTSAGNNALYMSADNGTTAGYSKSTSQFTWVYRTIQFDEAGTYNMTFDWRAVGESGYAIYDYMVGILLPENVLPQAATTTTCKVGEISSFSNSTTAATAASHGYTLLLNGNSPAFVGENEWQTGVAYALPIAAPGKYNLCFGWANDGSGGSDPAGCIDNISITKKACNDVTAVNVDSIGTDCIVLSWLPTNASYSIKVVKDHGETTETVLVSNTALTDTFVVLPGLTPATKYDLYVELVGLCDGMTGDTLKASGYITTACVPHHAPYSMGFEDMDYGTGTLPVCWSYVEGGDSYPYIYSSTSYAYEGSKSLYFYGGTSASVRIVALPEIADPLSDLRIRFQYKATSSSYTGASYPSFIVGVMTDPEDATTFLALDTLDQVTTYTAYEKYLTNVGDGYHYVAIKFAGGTSYGYAVIDNVVVDEIPSCVGATDLVVLDDETTLNSVSFGWTSDAPSFKVLYKLADEEAFTETVVTEPKITISGLQSSKLYNYEMKVVAVCSATEEAIDTLMATLNVATLCETISSLPWNEKFDELTSGIPSCWNNDEGTTTDDAKKWSVYATGRTGKCLRFNSYTNASGNTNVLSTPIISLPQEPAEFVFWCKNATGGAFSVSISANGAEREVIIPTLTSISDWTEEIVDLTSYAGQSVQFFFNATSNYGNGDAYMYIDDVKVREIPTCFPAKNLHAIDSLSTTSSVSFGWSPNSNETSWRVVVKNGETELKNEVVSDTVCTIAGLTSSTAYSLHVEVYVECGDIEAEALEGNLSLMTLCEAISTLPWVEDFEAMAVGSATEGPLCWDVVRPTSHANAYVYDNSNMARGTKSLFFRDGASGKVVYAVLPEFAYAMADKQIQFFYKHESTSNSAPLSFGYMTDLEDAASFHALYDCPMSASWALVEQVLSEVPANARLAFKYGGTGSDNWYCGVDSIVISMAPACHKPTEVEIVEVTPTSASFNWVGNADNYSVEIFNGTTRLDSTVVSANALPLVIDTLQPNTSYALRFNVFGLCGGEDGNSEAKSTILSVKTPCSLMPASELPYAENFENAVAGSGNLPDCWTNPLGGDYPYVYNSSSSSHAGSKCLYLYGGSSTTRRFAVLPGMEAPLSSLQLAFWYKQGTITADYGYLTVGVMSNPSDTSTFVAIQSLEKVNTYTQAEIILSAPADYHYIAFCIEGGNYSTSMYVDDINVSLAPNCKKVKNIEKASVTAYEAVFTWESNGDEEAWNVIVTDLANENAELVNATVNSRTVSVNNLSANTAYNFRVSVAANCGENEVSEAVSKDFSFRTALSPDMTEAIAPENTFTPNLGDASEQAKWIILGESETNHFIFGALEETPAMYISNNNSAWEYTLNAASGSMIYRQFSVADDSTEVRVQFDWQAYGEYTSYYYDYGRALIVAESAELSVSGSTLKIGERTIGTSDPQINGVYCLDDDDYALANVSVWTPLDKTIKLGNAGTYRLLFTWRNDTSSGTQHPLGVKNVSIENLGASIIPSNLINTDNDAIQVEKFIRDGQVYIVRDGKIYSIIGTVVR